MKGQTEDSVEATLEGFRERLQCNLCGSEKRSTLYRWPPSFYPHDSFATDSWDGEQDIHLQIVRCVDCGHVYSCPSFRESALHHVYPALPPQNDEGRVPAKVLDATKWRQIIRTLKRVLPCGSVVCDIGTRYGALVKALQEEGYQALGIEYNPSSVRLASRLGVSGVHRAAVPELPALCRRLGIGRLNGVVLDDVIEHLVDPMGDLTTVSAMQQEGDILLLRQMDYSSFGRRVFGRHWYYFQPAAHIHYFTPNTMDRLMSKLGYQIISMSRTPWYRQPALLLRAVVRRAVTTVPIARHRLLGRRYNTTDGRLHYLGLRSRLQDMFTVMARKTARGDQGLC